MSMGMRVSLPDPTQFEVVFRSITGHTIPLVGGIATDSRECRSGDMYIAIAGERVDGHNFIDHESRYTIRSQEVVT